MAWTRAQLDEVENAIMAIATGAQSYTINGRVVNKANIRDLYALRDVMRGELGVRRIVRRTRVNELLG